MNRDPFYRDIVRKLSEPLDCDLFERCAVDLLRKYYPSLVPISGGNDAGMDGANAHTAGGHLLVATTSSDVLGNLRRNLDTHKNRRADRHLAIVATSQALTERRRNNLEKAARELGFKIDQVYDRESLAALLYRRPEWCLDLLGLSGDRPPLSRMPPTARPLSKVPLVGRDAERQWLRTVREDQVLVGQPGAGKTALLAELADDGEALFVVGDDLTRVPAAIRAQQPSTVIVDDAHAKPELIIDLVHLRQEVGATFRIIASCWPGSKSDVARSLMVIDTQILDLPLLDRDKILRVVQEALGPLVELASDELFRELVDQAAGKPGLAVTLATACARGNLDKVASGEALFEEVAVKLTPLVDKHTTQVLAGFAMGGSAGMCIDAVARGLGLSHTDVHRIASEVAFGGVIVQHDARTRSPQGTLEVIPPALRHALVRRVFFSGAMSLPSKELINSAPNVGEVALTLMGAHARGATVADSLLRGLVATADSGEAWLGYVSLGVDKLNWVLENRPERFNLISRSALEMLPDRVIPLLLERARSDPRSWDRLNAYPDHPLRVIEDWVQSGRSGTGEPRERRQALLECGTRWSHDGGCARLALRALACCVSLRYSATKDDPGLGNKLVWTQGVVSLEDAREIALMWDGLVSLMREHAGDEWRPIQGALWGWVHPGMGFVCVPKDFTRFTRKKARSVLAQLVEIAAERGLLGVLHWARKFARQSGFRMPIAAHHEFDVLYPSDPRKWQANARAARALARRWRDLSPEVVANRIARFDTEARLGNVNTVSSAKIVCSELALGISDSVSWARAMIDAGVPPDAAAPLVERAVESDPAIASACLDVPQLRTLGLYLVLTREKLSDVLNNALNYAGGCADDIEIWARWGKLTRVAEASLLEHLDNRVVAATSQGIWNRLHEAGEHPRDTRLRDAVVRTVEDDFWLAKEFGRDPSLAMRWLERLIGGTSHPWNLPRALQAAIDAVDRDDRRRLIASLSPGAAASWLSDLVGCDPVLFELALSIDRLRRDHLRPLARNGDKDWAALAVVALDAGYTREQVERASGSRRWSCHGSEASMWERVASGWSLLQTHTDPRIRWIAAKHYETAERTRRDAESRERREAIHGIGR